MFATLGFAVALGLTRGVTTVLHYRGAGPNGGIIIDGVHIHHLVVGTIGLLLIGYLWLLSYGVSDGPGRRAFRWTAIGFGVAAALVLDEFALWLNLRDVYWQHQGRESFEAIGVFSALLLWGVLFAPYARAAVRHARGQPTPRRTQRL